VTHLYGFGDPGLAINPESIENQFLGCMVFFLSKAMTEEVRFDRKAVTSSDWVSYPILRFKDSPGVVVAKVLPRNDQPATAVGEAGGQAVAPAVANAFFDATGVRVRRVPLTPGRIRAVLANGGDDPAGYGV
jgi:CO/xanthine dehydrogenase Mo-binding subunit